MGNITGSEKLMEISIEDLKALEGVCPFSADENDFALFTPDYFIKAISNKALHPVFKVRLFTIDEGKAAPKDSEGIAKMTTEEISEMARLHVTGWDNLLAVHTGKTIAYVADEKGNPDKKLWSKIPLTIQGNILLHAIKISGLLHGEKLGLA
jgi:hypothetical protein